MADGSTEMVLVPFSGPNPEDFLKLLELWTHPTWRQTGSLSVHKFERSSLFEHGLRLV